VNQGIASIEFYLQAMTQPEIAGAMTRSKTYPMSPSCKVD